MRRSARVTARARSKALPTTGSRPANSSSIKRLCGLAMPGAGEPTEIPIDTKNDRPMMRALLLECAATDIRIPETASLHPFGRASGTSEHQMTENPSDPPNGDIKVSLREGKSYADYLRLDGILNAQHPLSTAHDEMLFIIQHQTSELWMKLAIHELSVTCQLIAADNLQRAFKTLSRVSRILEQLNSAWDVLRTMTPSEYTRFRESLGKSSGFQSYQYRLIEFLVGNKSAAVLRFHEHDKPVFEQLEAARHAPSLYDLTIRLLARRGLPIDPAVVGRDVAV